MDNHETPTEVVSQDGHPSPEHKKEFIDPQLSMVLMTWMIFICLLAILHKYAWKPILEALEARESSIRKSVDDADSLKEQLQKIEQTRRQVLTEAEDKSKAILEQSRKAAIEAANTIHAKARDEAQIVLDNARREIREEADKAQARLRQENANIAVALAGKIIEENLDTEKNRKLVSQFIKEL